MSQFAMHKTDGLSFSGVADGAALEEDQTQGEATAGSENEQETKTNVEQQSTDATQQEAAAKEDKATTPEKPTFKTFKDLLGKNAGALLDDDDKEEELTQSELEKKLKEKKDKEEGKTGEAETKDDTKDETKEVQGKGGTQEGEKKGRDFSDLPEKMVPLFKKMSNEAFDTLKPIYLEHQKLTAELSKTKEKIADLEKGIVKLPESYYEHPHGYTLDPEFAATQQNAELAKTVLDHWNIQLARIRQGKPWQDIVENNGQMSLTAPREATAEDEAAVIGYIQFANQQFVELQGALRERAKEFKTKHESAVKFVKDAESQYFPGFDDEKHPTKQIQQKIIEALPASYQKHPLASLLAKTVAANAMLSNELQVLKKTGGGAGDKGGKGGNGAGNGTGGTKVTQQPRRSAAGGGGGDSKPTITINDFKARLEQ